VRHIGVELPMRGTEHVNEIGEQRASEAAVVGLLRREGPVQLLERVDPMLGLAVPTVREIDEVALGVITAIALAPT